MTDIDTIRERHVGCKERKCLYYGGFRPCDTSVVLDALDESERLRTIAEEAEEAAKYRRDEAIERVNNAEADVKALAGLVDDFDGLPQFLGLAAHDARVKGEDR